MSLPRRSSIATLSYALVTLLPAGANAQEAPAAASRLEEIIVTARKTEESVQSVPISITALSSESIQKQAVLNVDDLRNNVPGLFVAANSQGGAPTFAIRAAKGDNGTSDTVTAYIDDMPVASTLSVANMVYDMQSISVLKGPQGTLFGANSTGGAIIFRPNKPSENFEGYAEAGVGNWDRREFEAMINVPVNDMLQLRLAGESVRRDGFVKNRGPDGGRLGNDHHDSARFSIRFKPTENWQHDLMLDYFNLDAKPVQAVPAVFRERFNYTTFLNGLQVPIDYALAGGTVVDDWKNVAAGGAPLYRKAKIWDAIYTTEYQLSDSATFKTVVGYQKNKLRTSEDNDSTPYPIVNIINGNVYKQLTVEPSLDTSFFDGRLRNKTGLFYSRKKLDQGGGGMVLGFPFDFTAFGPVPNAISQLVPNFYGLDSASFYKRDFKTYAAYTQFSYDLTDQLTATLGARYTWDKADYSAINRSYTGAANVARNIPLAIDGNYFPPGGACSASLAVYPDYDPVNCTAGADLKSSAPSFTFTLENKYGDNSMLYATARSGYIVGGFNNNVNPITTGVPIVFNPEKVVDFEIGNKSDWAIAGRPIRTNLAAFYISYKDQQRVQNGTTAGGVTFIGVVNAGSSTAYGLDFDVSYQPTDWLEFSASWNHIKSEYTKFDAIVNIPGKFAFVDLSGEPMSQTPKDRLNLSTTLTWPLPTTIGNVSSTVNWFWTSKTTHHDSPTFVCNTEPPTGGECVSVVPGQDFTAYDVLPSYGVWNFTTAWNDILGSNFDVNLWVKNVADKQYKTYGSNQMIQFGYATFSYGNPREYGVNLRYSF